MEGKWEHTDGSRTGHRVKFYGLSTCGWCRKTRQFLEDNDVSFDFIYVDLVPKGERGEVLEELTRWNPNRNFPTVVIDDDKVVVGYNPDSLKTELEL